MTTRLDESYVEDLLDRDDRRCVPCCRSARGKRGRAWDIWHRAPFNESRGGNAAQRSPANLLVMCVSCMDRCQEHPLLARQWGYRVWRSVPPETIPVLYPDASDYRSTGRTWPVPGSPWYLDPLAVDRFTRAELARVGLIPRQRGCALAVPFETARSTA